MNWTFVLGMLERIPATFWGVVVGSIFTLAGVVATNWHTGRRLKIQLEHDRALKTQERELGLRKEIYLEAAEAIAEGMNSIMHFADLSLPSEKLTQRFTEKAAAMAKVHVIAKENTAQAIANLTTEFGAAILRLSVKRSPLLVQQQQIELLEDQIDSFGKERDKFLESIKQMNIEGNQDTRRFEALNKNFEFEQSRVRQGLERLNVLRDDLRKNQFKYIEECMLESQALRGLLLPVIANIREELQLPLDQVAYSTIMAESLNKEARDMRAFLEQIAVHK